MKLFIAGSASDSIPEKYKKDCQQYLDALAKKINNIYKDNTFVFGACSLGLMGLTYNIAKNNNIHVEGMCPEVYKEDLKYLECDKVKLTNSILERTQELIENSDAIIFLPGGIGTLHELYTSLELKKNGVINHPIIIYNSCGYYDSEISRLSTMSSTCFAPDNLEDHYCIVDNVDKTINKLPRENINRRIKTITNIKK